MGLNLLINNLSFKEVELCNLIPVKKTINPEKILSFF
jgi:hypothetical protein